MEFNVKNYNEKLAICTISGRLLIDDEVNNVLESLNDTIENKDLVLDLSQLEYISSSGLSLFIRLLTRSRINDHGLVLANLQENVKKLFQIAKLNNIFAISDSTEEAIKSLN